MDDRATSSVVGKLLGAGLVLLYLSGATAVLFGGVIPDAQRATGQELAERTVADVAGRLERTIEPVRGRMEGRIAVEAPTTIAGSGYRLRLRDEEFALLHPNDAFSTVAPLELPSAVTVVDSTVDSGASAALVVRGEANNRTIRLVEGKR
jgi:hypothetical protein